MRYENIVKGKFLKRLNRFTAIAEVNGKEQIVHVKNTGRLKEILIPDAVVFLSESKNPLRKTRYDLIAAIKNTIIVNIDSQAPNKVFYEYLKSGKFLRDITYIKPESFFKNSRFDFYVETPNRKIFIEVKGVTLLDGENVLFPDAPTERGVRHINELCDALAEGYDAYIIFVVQLKGAKSFMPNEKTHNEFALALRKAEKLGVKIYAYDCCVSEDSLKIDKKIKTLIERE